MSIMDERLQAIRSVLRKSELPASFISYILNTENNPAQFPYHNSFHCQTVAYNCILASQKMKVTDFQVLEMVIASLLHDWNHSGGEHEDHVNISRAEAAYMRMKFQFKLNLNHEAIISFIRATEFPHKKVDTLAEKIIQDADLLQYLHSDCSDWVRRYSKESGLKQSNEETAQWLEAQKFNTMWGKDMRRLACHKLRTAEA